MSRIGTAFEGKKAFIGFLTGGDPCPERTESFIHEMIEGGADLIEIGIPFSDPIAEGPVIQAANLRALSAGTTVDRLFKIAGNVSKTVETPLVFLTYLNPVFHYGYEAFFDGCREAGVDGVIIPDLPFEEQPEAKVIAAARGVDVISLVAPTSADRILHIAREASGFLYVVSSLGVTGMRSQITTDLGAMIKTIRQATDLPAAVGFGINTPEQARAIAAVADGVIVGSAIVRIIEEHGEDAGSHIRRYVEEMKRALTQ
jgi:tryptophan synthase alpha chain